MEPLSRVPTPRLDAIRCSELEPRLATGDVVLFHGASRRSQIIERATRSEFSHVGMIVRGGPGKTPLLWHTDPRPVAEDIEYVERHPGAQLNDFRTAMAIMTNPKYGDTPYVRQLIVERTAEFEERALRAIAALDGTTFPSLLRIMKEWILGRMRVTTKGKKMFCAEVLAATYQQMGLLPSEPPANSYAPRDFSFQHERLHLLRGARLGAQIEVVDDVK